MREYDEGQLNFNPYTMHKEKPKVEFICTLPGVDGYIKKLIDEIRLVLKRNELKASRTRIILLWSLDKYEMKGEKHEKLSELETKLKDYIGDVESSQIPLDIFSNDKTVIIVACSQLDYDYISKDKKDVEYIIIKANPLCEVFPQK